MTDPDTRGPSPRLAAMNYLARREHSLAELGQPHAVQNSVDGPEPRTGFLPASPVREHRQDLIHLSIDPLVITGQV